jgi:hypothetical protein
MTEVPANPAKRVEGRHAPECLVEADRHQQPEDHQSPPQRHGRRHYGRGDGDHGQRHHDAKDPIAQRRTHADDCTLHAIWLTVANSVARLSTANPGYAAAAFVLYVISLVIAGARWRGFRRALRGHVSVMRATVPRVGGVAAGGLTPSPEEKRAASDWADRQPRDLARGDHRRGLGSTLELPPILVLTAMALVAVPHLAVSTATVVTGVSIAFAIIALAAWRVRRSGLALAGWRERLAVDRVRASLFAAGVGYSSLLWLQDFLRLVCVTLAFGVVLSPTKIATLSMLAMLGGVVPAIAGLGQSKASDRRADGVRDRSAHGRGVTALGAISYGFSTSAGAVMIA